MEIDKTKHICKKEHKSILRDNQAHYKNGKHYWSTRCGAVKPHDEISFFWEGVTCEICLHTKEKKCC